MKSILSKIKVKFIEPSEKDVGEFCALYRKLIPQNDQVDLSSILQRLAQPNRAPRSIDELANRTQWSGQKSYYLMLGASLNDKLLGFANVVFVPSMQVAFIADLAALPTPGKSGAVSRAIFDYIESLGSVIPWRWLVFELPHDGVRITRALARQRLFRRYLRGMKREPYRLSVPYRVPSLKPEFQTADLMITAVSLGSHAPSSLAKASVLNLVRSIYFDIYADALTPAVNSYLYCAALEAQLKILEKKLPEQVPLLGEFRVHSNSAQGFFSAQMTYA